MGILHSLLWLLSSEGIQHVVQVWGLAGICLIIFGETGIFPILPGDSLLVVAGLMAATLGADGVPLIGVLGLLTLVPLCALMGDQVGYWVGRALGWAVLDWKEKRLGPLPLFKPQWLKQSHEFYIKWGAMAVVACRWVPIVRTFSPLLAGASKMPYRRFLSFGVLGAVSWVWSMVGLGYGLKVGLQAAIEQFVPGFDVAKHIDKIALVIVILSIMPIVMAYFRQEKAPKIKAKRARPENKKKKRV